MEQAEAEQKSIALLNLLASRFTSLNPDVNVHFEGGQEGTEVQDLEVESSAPAAVSAEQKTVDCPGCGQPCAKKKAISCHRLGCVTAGMHVGCMERCAKCSNMFCSGQCTGTHVCL